MPAAGVRVDAPVQADRETAPRLRRQPARQLGDGVGGGILLGAAFAADGRGDRARGCRGPDQSTASARLSRFLLDRRQIRVGSRLPGAKNHRVFGQPRSRSSFHRRLWPPPHYQHGPWQHDGVRAAQRALSGISKSLVQGHRSMKFRAVAVQMVAADDKAANLKEAEHWVRAAAGEGARIVALPEVFIWRGNKQLERGFAEPIPGPTSARMAELAREREIYLLAGSILEA